MENDQRAGSCGGIHDDPPKSFLTLNIIANDSHLVYNPEVDNLLKNNGYKTTPARLAILDFFKKNSKPVNAETIHKNIKKFNEATIYRTLLSLEKIGVLKKVNLQKDANYFELANRHHHHIVCTECDKIEDFENEEIEKMLKKIELKSSKFKNIKEHSLELFGLCVNCS